jgi:hypothetical protein
LSSSPGPASRDARLVDALDLPGSLWNPGASCLQIPPDLARVYRDCIHRHGLAALSLARKANDSPVGGLSQAETDAHFAQQFCGSVARAQLALLDPHQRLSHVADALTTLLSGGKVALLDLPSGAGALALSLLCTVAELRAWNVLPRYPLDVVVIGGEISEPARQYADELFRTVAPALAQQAIFVTHTQARWDACDRMSNTQLMQRFITATSGCERKIVAISNFSGFLARAGKQREAAPQLEEIFRYASGGDSSAVWLEPQVNKATKTGGILDWAAKQVRDKFPGFARLVWPREHEQNGSAQCDAEANYTPPMRPGEPVPVRLTVLRFELPGVK